MKTIFVGGPMDGKVKDVEMLQPYFETFVRAPLQDLVGIPSMEALEEYTPSPRETYFATTLRGVTKDFIYYRHESLDKEQARERLFEIVPPWQLEREIGTLLLPL